MPKVVIYTDGGARGNPGPAGAGAIVLGGNGEEIERISEFLGVQTNNYAEYEAIVLALEKCLEAGLEEEAIEFRSDSKLAVEQLSGNWKVKDAGIREQFNRVQELLEKFRSVTFVHVRREHNKVADALANEAMDRA